MYILDSEIKRIITSEKEFRYAYFIKIKDVLERMTVSMDDSSKTYRINARIAESEEQKYILSLKIGMNGRIEQFHCGCPLASSKSACRHVGAVLLFLKTLEIILGRISKCCENCSGYWLTNFKKNASNLPPTSFISLRTSA